MTGHTSWDEITRRPPPTRRRRAKRWVRHHRPTLYVWRLWQLVLRARRGYSDQDLWSFDYYLARTISRGLADMAKMTHTFPSDATYEEWISGLSALSAEFAYLANWDNNLDSDLEGRKNAALERLGVVWFDLWD